MTVARSDLAVGQAIETVVVDDLRRTRLVQYAGASGDYNPLHTDEPYAVEAGYPSVFAHGMLTMGLTGTLLTDTFGPGRVLRYGGRFSAQVFPGDTLTARAVVDAIRDDGGPVADLSITTTNQHGTVVFSGTAAARLGPVEPA